MKKFLPTVIFITLFADCRVHYFTSTDCVIHSPINQSPTLLLLRHQYSLNQLELSKQCARDRPAGDVSGGLSLSNLDFRLESTR